MGLVYDFPSCLKDFITIHEYANNIICLTYHVISGVCLGFNLIPNKNIIMSSFKSSRDIQKKEGGPDSCFG